MKFYRQYDYPNVQLGEYGKITIETAGCFVVSLANMANIDPVQVNALLAENKCFVSGNMLANKAKTAELLGLEWSGRTTEKPNHICIAETRDTPAPQHFFVYDPETNEMNDPLSNKRDWEKCTYNIVSYRTFKAPSSGNKTVNETEEKKRYENIEKGISNLTLSEILEKILAEQKKYFSIADQVENQKGRESASFCGQLVREAQKQIGLEVSK